MHKYKFYWLIFFASVFLIGGVAIVIWPSHPDRATGLQPQVLGPQPVGDRASIQQERLSSSDGLISEPTTAYAVKMDQSPALREIPIVSMETPSGLREMGEPGEMEQIVPNTPRPPVEDPVLQSTFSGNIDGAELTLAPAPLKNFDGLVNWNGVYPPDTNGDVGKNHYVQMVNLSFQVWNKNGTSVYGPADTKTLWTGFGAPCETTNDGDPIVLYDQLADRWILSQFTWSASMYGECVAVSTSGDPTGSYYRYYFQFSTTEFYDYPKLGVWTDGYYLTANRFSSFFLGTSAIVLERAQMLQGKPARFIEFKTGTAYGSLLPADLDGFIAPPAGSPAFLIELSSVNLNLLKFKVNWSNPPSSTFTGPTSIPIAAYNYLCLIPYTRSCIPQPGTSIKLDGIGDRLMHRLVYRNFGNHEALVVSHSVNASAIGVQAGFRWYEIRNPNGNPVIYQQGTYSPDSTNRWMSSIAINRSGTIASVYSVSSASVYPGIRYTARLATDPLGQMFQGENTLIAGSGSQTGPASRWGDYAMISVDPVDDCTFWMTTEYMPTTSPGAWKTRIGSFAFPECTNVGVIIGKISDSDTGFPLPGVKVEAWLGASSYPIMTTSSNALGDYLLGYLPPGVYKVAASRPGYFSTEVSNISVTVAQTVTQNLALLPFPYKIFVPMVIKNFTN